MQILATIEKVQFGKNGKNVARFTYRLADDSTSVLNLLGDDVQWFRDHGLVKPGVWDGLQVWLKKSGTDWVWDGWLEDSVKVLQERLTA